VVFKIGFFQFGSPFVLSKRLRINLSGELEYHILKHNENLSLIQKVFLSAAVALLLPDICAYLLLLTFGQKVLNICGLAGFNPCAADGPNEIHTRCHRRAKVA
jgi:hypothetical protein